MPITILGKCRPGQIGGCTDPLDPMELESVVLSLPITAREGDVDLLIPGQIVTPLPPKLSNTIMGVVKHPDNQKYGLFHLNELKTIWINASTFRKVLNSGLFIPGNYYYQLVYAVNAIGLEVVDIEYTYIEEK